MSTILMQAQKNSVTEMRIHDQWQMREAKSAVWQSAIVPGCVHSDLILNGVIPDPYYRTNEKDLQWIEKKDWEYKTSLNLNNDMLKNEHVELVFKGLDTFADVYINDIKVLTADNMYLEWVIDAKPFLHKGDNTIRVYFHSPIKKGLELLRQNGYMLVAQNEQTEMAGMQKNEVISPFIRKAPYHFGWDWGPRLATSGIWQEVFLRSWVNIRMSDFYVQQLSLTDKLAKLNGQIEILSSKDQAAEVEIQINKKQKIRQKVQLKSGINKINIPFDIKNPKLWWTNGLGTAYLYNITASISNNQSFDSITRNTGLRTIKLIQQADKEGHSFYFELNGVPVFAKGANHIPNDMFPSRVSKETYDWEIETAVKSNMNMIRVWGGGIYETDYFYELCDRNGILVWQDFMFACSLYPGNNSFLESVTKEAAYQVKRLRNHPSIAMWCGNNEIDVALSYHNPTGGWGWKQQYNEQQLKKVWHAYDTIFNKILANAVQHYASETAYTHSSPMTMSPNKHAEYNNANGDVHYWGVWWGKEPFEKYADNIGRFMSEYGFQSFPNFETVKKYALPEDYDIESEVMRHHQRSTIGNVTIKEYMDMYYRKPKDFEKFLYVSQVLQAQGVQYAIESHRQAMPINMGTLYWQLNDCWPVASWSSSDYYKRWKALQYTAKRSFEPVIITAFNESDSVSISVISDKLNSFEANLEIQVCDFNGNVLNSSLMPVTVKANTVTSVIIRSISGLTSDKSNSYLRIKLKAKGVDVSKLHYFTAPKNLNLKKTAIQSKVVQSKGSWLITLKSDVLVKNLYLNFAGVEGSYSNNYFDLEAGKEIKVQFRPKNESSALVKLEFMSLVDSY